MIESNQIPAAPTVHIVTSNPSADHISDLLELLYNNSIPYNLQQDTNSLGLPLSQRYFVLVDNIKGTISLGPQFSSILMFVVGYPRKGENKKNHYCKKPFEVIQKYEEFCELPEPQKTIIFTSKFRSSSQLHTIKSISRKTFSHCKTKSIDKISEPKISEKLVKPQEFRIQAKLRGQKQTQKLEHDPHNTKKGNIIFLLRASCQKNSHYKQQGQYNALIRKISLQDHQKYIQFSSFQQFTSFLQSASSQVVCLLAHESSISALGSLKNSIIKRLAIVIYVQKYEQSEWHPRVQYFSCQYAFNQEEVRKKLLKLAISMVQIEPKRSKEKANLHQTGVQTEKRIRIGRGISFHPKTQLLIPSNEDKVKFFSSSFHNDDKQKKQREKKDSFSSDSLRRSDSYFQVETNKMNKKREERNDRESPSKILKKIEEYFPDCSPIKKAYADDYDYNSQNYSTISKIIKEHVPIKLQITKGIESNEEREDFNSRKKQIKLQSTKQKVKEQGPETKNTPTDEVHKKKIRIIIKPKTKNEGTPASSKDKGPLTNLKRVKSQYINPILSTQQDRKFPLYKGTNSILLKKQVIMPEEYFFPSSSSKILPIISINQEVQARILRSKTLQPLIKYGSEQMIQQISNKPNDTQAIKSLNQKRNNDQQNIPRTPSKFSSFASFENIQYNEENKPQKTRSSLEEVHMQTGRFLNSINFATFGDMKNQQLSINSNRHQSIVSIQNKQNSNSNKIYNYSPSLFSQSQPNGRKITNSFGQQKNSLKQQLDCSPFFARYRSESLHIRHKPYCILFKRENKEISQFLLLVNKKLNEKHSSINVRKHEFSNFKDLRNVVDLLPGQSRFIIFTDTQEINEFADFMDDYRKQRAAQFDAYGRGSEEQFMFLYVFGQFEKESFKVIQKYQLNKEMRIMGQKKEVSNQIVSEQIVQRIERNGKKDRRRRDKKEYMSSNGGAIQIL